MNQKLKKSLAVGIIALFIGIAAAPIINATHLPASSVTNNYRGFDEEDFVEVTYQVHTFTGVKEIVKKVPKTRVEKIMALANEVNALFDKKPSIEDVRKRVTALAVEMKHTGLLPKNMDVDDTVNLMMSKRFVSRHFDSFVHNQRINSGDREDNILVNMFCFVFGIGENWTESLTIGNQILILILRGLINLPLEIALLLCLLRPKIVIPFGSWCADPDASLSTVGLNGIKKLSDRGPSGLYWMFLVGFLGITLHFGSSGGFISGSSLFSIISFLSPP